MIRRTKERAPGPLPAGAGVLIARQPIFDRRLEVAAYELLFRSVSTSPFDIDTGSRATAQVLVESLMDHGTEVLADGRPVYVNFTRDLIIGGYVHVASPKAIVVEVLEDVPPDRDVLAALAEAREAGYRIALDDVVDLERVASFAEVASVVKVDVLGVAPAALPRLVAGIRRAAPQAELIAEKVETWPAYRHVLGLGVDGFQGYFLSKPVVLRHRSVPGFKPHYIQLLEATSRADVDLDEIERIVRSDLALTNKLLRHANSAAAAQRRPFESLREALVLLGTEGVRRAAALLALAGLGADRPQQLAVTSVVRARFCESLAAAGEVDASEFDLFLLGMFSMADAILGMPMERVVREVPVTPAVACALVEREEPLGDVLALVEAHERAEWDRFREVAATLRIDVAKVTPLYVEAVRWARRVFDDGRS